MVNKLTVGAHQDLPLLYDFDHHYCAFCVCCTTSECGRAVFVWVVLVIISYHSYPWALQGHPYNI